MMKSRFKKIKIFLWVGLLLIVFMSVQGLVGMLRNPNQMGIIESMVMDMDVQVPEGLMPVEMTTVRVKSFAPRVTYTGEIKAYNDVPVFSRVEGWLVSLPVYAGDAVKKGQLLARLDQAELDSVYQRAYSSQQRSQNAIKATKADLDYWTSEIKRAEALLQDDVITQEEYDREKSQFESAVSKYHQARAQNNEALANTQVQAIKLGYTSVVAPVGGVITERPVDTGMLVHPGMELFRLAQLSPIRVQAHVSGVDFSRIKQGQRVWVQKQGDGFNKENRAEETVVSSVFPNKDLTTRTAIIEALLPNKNGDFVPGDFVTLSIEVGERAEALMVPRSAVIRKNRETAVWAVKEGKAHLRYITTGSDSGTDIEIVSGLSEGEQVITQGHGDIFEGYGVVAAKFRGGQLEALPTVENKKRFSEENHYRIKQSFEHGTFYVQLEHPPARVGMNRMILELTSPHDVKNIWIDAKTFMPAMPKMRVPQPSVKLEKEGRYGVEMDFTMAGLWHVDLILRQGEKVMAKSAVEIEVLN